MDINEKIKEVARNAAAAEIFSHMASEEKSNGLLNQLQALPDELLDVMAKVTGIPETQFHIHRSMVRGEKNVFTDGLESVDGLLQIGDIILMTGNSAESKALAKIQRAVYKKARSSHVALVHADFICIDATPKLGVSNRIISEVLFDASENWQVIRHQKLEPQNLDKISRACVYYLFQPYKILPSINSAKTYAYCSELARKIYKNSLVEDHGIPNNFIIKPANFDRLADNHPQWVDVTEKVRPAIDFCRQYPELLKVSSKLFIDGLKLNRKRFDDRADLILKIREDSKTGEVSRIKEIEITEYIKDMQKYFSVVFG